MNQLQKSAAVIFIFCGLAACAKSEPKPPLKVEDTVFADLVKAKERAAKETEKAMELNRQKLEEAMKKNEEAPTP